jgi:tRNA (mo5U34)-methyltransferase
MDYTDEQIRAKIDTVKHWYHQIEIRKGIVTPGSNPSSEMLSFLGLPDDLSGLRVLDLGCRDGFYSFACEKRNAAEIIAVDYVSAHETGFDVASELLRSKVKFIHENVYNITSSSFGEFDVVLMLGLLYHLPDPFGALAIARSVCKGELYLATHTIDNALIMPNGDTTPLRSLSEELVSIPLMQFIPRDALSRDYTNYWIPNVRCLDLMLAENNFDVLKTTVVHTQAVLRCKAVFDPILGHFSALARGGKSAG